MKYIFLMTLFFCLTSLKQENKLNGAYNVVFENYFDNDGYVTFYGDNFKWRPFHYLPFEGKINYHKNTIYLESDSNLIYGIRTENIKNDTIVFSVHDKNGKGNWLDIAIGRGKLIKVK
ncbi:hypothetical protein [Flavobacterium capsici]|uniref:Uncharacterized protein n=1 Tax=Flavobacterium capsici TaxID=3075618 RepID=A0AA96F756_9FLAO|nr:MULTISPECIES: hypothetical protein [unclassified Flavobacterium]WNM18799.1 hypothetical protein RN608_12395 [Flavobacterium sp. PMR2A8]WNM22850.1 hypothetical protein RN605_05695 [Flavobacterium sp. PMTSA4]